MVFDQILKSCKDFRNPARITKADKNFVKRLDFRDIKIPVKTRDIHKIEKKKELYQQQRFWL